MPTPAPKPSRHHTLTPLPREPTYTYTHTYIPHSHHTPPSYRPPSQVYHQLHTLRVEMYLSTADQIRYYLELVLTGTIALVLLWSILGGMIQSSRHDGSMLAYFMSTWTWINLGSTGLMAVCMGFWWWYVRFPLEEFDIQIKYQVRG